MMPDGRRVYVSNGRDASVMAIDTSTNRVTARIEVGQRPWNMALTPVGRKLYVASGRSNAVSVIDTATNTKLRDIPVGNLPWRGGALGAAVGSEERAEKLPGQLQQWAMEAVELPRDRREAFVLEVAEKYCEDALKNGLGTAPAQAWRDSITEWLRALVE